MPSNTHSDTPIAAALMLLARETVKQWPDWPTTDEILKLTGCGRSQAYEMMARLRDRLPTLLGKLGRPALTPPPPDSVVAVSRHIQGYLLRHPGSAQVSQERFHYTDNFRRFIVGLVGPGQPGEGLSVAQLAEASSIPHGTLKSWFSQPSVAEPEEPTAEKSIRQEHDHQIIKLYESWNGTFVNFCRMIREEHRLNYGDTAIGTLLHRAGQRRRKKSTKQADQNRGTFRKFFPGAQWLGDGSKMMVHGISMAYGGETFVFNLEALLDVSSGALIGLSVSDYEDEAVVLSAFQDAIAATGEAPFSLSLDNRPSNHTPAVMQATQEKGTALLRTTPGRPQSKAPLEGTFGLLKQGLPELVVHGENAREQARSVLGLVVGAWARGRNGRPRKNLGNKSPSDYYRDTPPTPEQIAEAKRWIEEERRRQEAIRRTREERAEPVKLEFLKQTLLDLAIADPEHRLAADLAYYPLDPIVDGITIYETKRQLGTTPPGHDPGRYLRGIIRNVHEQNELTLNAELHIKNRSRLRDLTLKWLLRQASDLRLRFHGKPELLLTALVDEALGATCTIDHQFWTLQSAEALAEVPIPQRRKFYDHLARRVAATFRADRDARQWLLARLAHTLSDL
jgi:transposase InsO family protein